MTTSPEDEDTGATATSLKPRQWGGKKKTNINRTQEPQGVYTPGSSYRGEKSHKVEF